MCLMVYLGTDKPVPGFSDVAIGAIGLDPDVGSLPEALKGKKVVRRVCDRTPVGWNCSCVFIDQVLPWEADKGDDPNDPETPIRAAAYADLARIAAAAVAVDPDALVFSCWAGDEGRAPQIERELGPSDIRPARYIFDDITDTGSAGNPPVLVRLKAERADG